jgi:hypothetical protein
MIWKKSWRRLAGLFLLICSVITLSCSQQSEKKIKIWIDAPQPNTRVQPGDQVMITSHVYSPEGKGEVLLSVNEETYLRQDIPAADDSLSEFQFSWLAGETGDYLLKLEAYDLEGNVSAPALLPISVVQEIAAIDPIVDSTVTPLPEIDITVTPFSEEQSPACPPRAEAVINANCRSGPGEIYDFLSVLKEGESSPVVGRSQDSSYWVIERPDAAGNCWIWSELVELNSSDCKVLIFDTPAPPEIADSDPPPVPSPMVPADGLDIDCGASQNLVWLPVEDPSGIEGYYLKLEKEVSGGNWEAAGNWGAINGKQHSVSIDCGLRYRWRVRAEDGAGNFSPWSSYSYFTVNLD